MEAGHRFGSEVVILPSRVGRLARRQESPAAVSGAARWRRSQLAVGFFLRGFWLKRGRNVVKTWSWLRKVAAWSPKARGRPAAVAAQSGRRAESHLGALPGPVTWPGAPWLFSGSAGRADLSGRKPAAWRQRTRTAARSRPTAAAAGVGAGWPASPGGPRHGWAESRLSRWHEVSGSKYGCQHRHCAAFA